MESAPKADSSMMVVNLKGYDMPDDTPTAQKVQGKKIIFNKYRDFRCMIDEVVNFGHSPHDDCADSLNIVVQGLMRRGGAQISWD